MNSIEATGCGKIHSFSAAYTKKNLLQPMEQPKDRIHKPSGSFNAIRKVSVIGAGIGETNNQVHTTFPSDTIPTEKKSLHPVVQFKDQIDKPSKENFNPIVNRNRKIINLKVDLQNAAMFRSPEDIEKILKKGAKINETNNQGYTTLHLAVEYKNYLVIPTLIKNKANASIKNDGGDAPIHTACKQNDAASLKALLEGGADISQENSIGNALVVSIKYQSMNCFNYLLKVDDRLLSDKKNIIRIIEGVIELIESCEICIYNSKEPLKLLFLRIYYSDWRDDSGKDIIMYILTMTDEGDHLSNFKLFVALLEITNSLKDNDNNNLWHYVASHGHGSLFPILKKRGMAIDINAFNNFGSTPFLSACETAKNKKILRDLIKYGADPKACGTNGFNALHVCAYNNNINKDIVEFLLQYVSINSKNTAHGITPLHIAAIQGNKKLVKILIECGADVNSEDMQGRTSLHKAGYCLYECIIKYNKLKKCKVMTEEQRKKLENILHVQNNYIAIITMLTPTEAEAKKIIAKAEQEAAEEEAISCSIL